MTESAIDSISFINVLKISTNKYICAATEASSDNSSELRSANAAMPKCSKRIAEFNIFLPLSFATVQLYAAIPSFSKRN